ncbi:MAG: hypothetical protein R6U44_07040 [Archaeoglobaceae archaeon]
MKSNKYYLKILFLFALLFMAIFSSSSLFIALLFLTLFVPGYVIVERFFGDMKGKVGLYILLSVLVSTQLIYFLSLFGGYSLETLQLSAVLLSVSVLFIKKPEKSNERVVEVVIFIILFLFAFTLMYPTVWFEKDDYIVLSGSNWQDGPFHLEIIESLNQGNFPPEDPTFAGEPLHYHYFVDLHTAILEKPLDFYPRLMLYANSFLFPLFFISMWGFSFYITGSRRTAVYSSVLAVFGWGFIYVWLFSTLLSGNYEPVTCYVMDYGGILNLPPILDNLLQQRPLLIGLPGLVFALYAFIIGYENDRRNYVLLSGILTGLVFPFHILASFSAYLLVGLYVLRDIIMDRSNLRKKIWRAVPFVISLLFFIPFLGLLSPGGSVETWVSEFVQVNIVVHYVANLGLPLIMAVGAAAVRVKRWSLLALWALVMLIFPLVPSLTPNNWDMYKFFLIAWIPLSILAGQFLGWLERFKRMKYLIPILLVFSILSTVPIVLCNQTDYECIDYNQLQAGLWVRENTSQESVFLMWHSTHSPPTMVGGRLRVLGYTNWPFGHGVEPDKIFDRVGRIDKGFNSTENLEKIVKDYGVDYIYIGEDERYYLPQAESTVKEFSSAVLIYKENRIKIYKVRS